MASVAPTDRATFARTFFSCPARYTFGNYRIQLRADLAKKLLGNMAGLSIVDLGCGDGSIALALLESTTKAGSGSV